MPALAHLEGQGSLRPCNIKRLVECDAIDDPDRYADSPEQCGRQMGKVLAIAGAGIQSEYGIILFGVVLILDGVGNMLLVHVEAAEGQIGEGECRIEANRLLAFLFLCVHSFS